MAPSMQLVLLGTGTPRLDPNRSGPASAVVVNGAAYLVDAGPGVVRRTAAALAKGVQALVAPNLKTLFLTHLHSDHTIGYPDVILSPWVVGRRDPLQSFGPSGLNAMTTHLLKAYAEDIDVRVKGLEHGNGTGWQVNVHEIQPGFEFEDPNVGVKAFEVKHGSWNEALGYRFEGAGRTIVFSGDTRPCETLVEAATDADILVHEVYANSEATAENRPGGQDWPDYLRSYHTSAAELGAIAARCQPNLLVLVHVLRRNVTDKELIAEIRQGGFRGRIVVGKDLDVY